MALKPKARPRLFLNQCATTPSVGPNTQPHAKPTAKPWHNRNCQYSLHSATRNVERTRKAEEKKRGTLNHPISKRRPVTRPGIKTNAYYTGPIIKTDINRGKGRVLT